MPRHLHQPLASEDYLGKVLARTRENDHVLGDLCRYDLDRVEIEPKELFDALEKRGLEKWNPVPIRKRTAARKAITLIRPMLEDPSSDLRVIVRPVHTNEQNVIRYAIIDEETNQQVQDLEFSTRNQVLFRLDTGTMEFTKDVVPEILEAFEHLCSVYTDPEILLMVKNIVTNHGCIWLRDNTGEFFMPHMLKGVVDALQRLFDEDLAPRTKGYCFFRPIAILDDERNKATMGQALLADIKVDLGEATETLDKALEDESKLSLNAALRKFKVANGKAKLYQDMLKLNLDTVTDQIGNAEAKAAALLTKLAEK